MAAGRGPGSLLDDTYAIGVTTLTLLTGQVPCQGMSNEEVLEAKLSKGSYAALAQQARITLTVMEALRGLLNDDPQERWTLKISACGPIGAGAARSSRPWNRGPRDHIHS